MKRIILIFLASIAFIPVPAQDKTCGEACEKGSAPTFVHPWYGKRVAYFGDSITDPGTLNGGEFYRCLEEWLHITPYVYGVSGTRWDNIPTQMERLINEHGDDFDAIIIFMGTNDFNMGVPIGEWYKERAEGVMASTGEPLTEYKRLRRYPLMDPDTYRGCINIALDKLKRRFPTKQIVLLTPLHRGYFEYSETNLQPEECYQNKCGEYIDAYIESVKEAGSVWAVPVIDWSNLSGIFPLMEEHLQYFKNKEWDQLHPNREGHRRMALTLCYQLLTLPCTF